jgi:nicotinate-nucleotide adenylyltransferase
MGGPVTGGGRDAADRGAADRDAADRGAAASAGPATVVPGRIGILGGTFDPIHHGHLAIAEAAREGLGLERVVFVPARTPPHRPDRPIAGADDRAAMVALAIAANPAFELSRMELDREGPSFAVDTVRAFIAEAGPGRQPDLWFILSADAFAGFLDWRDPAGILDLCRLAVLPRDGHPPADLGAIETGLPGHADRVRLLDGPRLRLAATEVRARAARGLSVRYLVPDAVAAYIGDHRLYREAAALSGPRTGGTFAP